MLSSAVFALTDITAQLGWFLSHRGGPHQALQHPLTNAYNNNTTSCSIMVVYTWLAVVVKCKNHYCDSLWLLCPFPKPASEVLRLAWLCVCVCMSVRSHSHISKNTRPMSILHEIFCTCYTCSRNSDLLWQQCNNVTYFRFRGWSHVLRTGAYADN